jgi:hypothetical protein
MSDLKFEIRETAGDDDHKMYTKMKIEGESLEVRNFLKRFLDD